jgi:hypothetical protein
MGQITYESSSRSCLVVATYVYSEKSCRNLYPLWLAAARMCEREHELSFEF